MDPLSAAQPELAAAVQAVGPGPSGFAGASQVGVERPPRPGADQSSAILKLKGLPYSATEDDIRQFFAPYELKGVSFVYEPDGRPSGLAFAEFASKEEALKALSKNGEYIGQRYVRLLHVPRAEMEEQVRLGTLAIPGAAAKLRSRMIRSQQRNSAVYMAGGPMQLVPTVMPGGRPVIPALGPHAGPGPAPGLGASYGQPTGPGQMAVESRIWQPAFQQSYPQQAQQPGQALSSQQLAVPGQALQAQQLAGPGHLPGQQYQAPTPAQLAAQFSGLGLGGQVPQQPAAMHQHPHGAPGLPPRGAALLPQGLAAAQGLHLGPPPPGSAAAGMGVGVGVGVGGHAHFVAGTRVVQAATSPTIKIRGLPYGSSPSEILGFFQSYQYLPDTLQIGLDQLGRPSGEAWLSFSGPQEALRAVRDLNRHYLGNRYLELSIC